MKSWNLEGNLLFLLLYTSKLLSKYFALYPQGSLALDVHQWSSFYSTWGDNFRKPQMVTMQRTIDHRLYSFSWYTFNTALTPKAQTNHNRGGRNVVRARGLECLLRDTGQTSCIYYGGLYRIWKITVPVDISTWMKSTHEAPSLERKLQSINDHWQKN